MGLTLFADKIYQALFDDLDFKSVATFLPLLQNCNKDLKDALLANGLRNATSLIEEKRYRVERLLKVIAALVEYEADDNEALALRSGFEIKKDPVSRPSKTFGVEHGVSSGTVDLYIKAENRASYIWEYCVDPLRDEGWVRAGVTIAAKHHIKGLTPGLLYWFQVAVVTKDGQQPFSAPFPLRMI